MRLATKPIISLSRTSSEPFSSSAFRVILSIVMVRSLGCVLAFATRANLDSDHDSSPHRCPCGHPGEKTSGVVLRSALGPPSGQRPALVSYTTPRDANPVTAQSLWVEGLPDCGSWVQARTAGKASVLESHLLGMLNGAAIGTHLEFWLAGGIPVNREQV